MKFKVKNRRPRPVDKTLYNPAEYLTIEQLPSGKWGVFETPELKPIPPRPDFMICDCCLAKADRMWILKHYGFCTGFPNAGKYRRDFLPGAWGFCVYCWALFVDGDIQTLAIRVETLNPELSVSWLQEVFRVLREVTYGEVVTWESGQAWRSYGEGPKDGP